VTSSPLEGRTALVTGSSRNLGAAIVSELATSGVTVAVHHRDSEADARRVATELSEKTGKEHPVLRADLTSVEETRRLCEEVLQSLGTVDILVNNAGPFSMDPFVELAESEWDRIWNANVRAAFLCTQHLAPGMRQSGWGRIVNISAGSAYIRNHSIYTLAKEALITLTEELALELGPEITVNAVAPGQIAESAEDIAEFDPTFVKRSVEWTPAGRLVTRPEVATLVRMLCEPPFDMVTGVTMPIDGGWRLPRF
jgi:NAD(P)-dependent dehydrogenase (short-subunit alcohol dehydrogenase family)